MTGGECNGPPYPGNDCRIVGLSEEKLRRFLDIPVVGSFGRPAYSCSFQTSAPSPVSFSTIRS
jgi:hypothetical protein